MVIPYLQKQPCVWLIWAQGITRAMELRAAEAQALVISPSSEMVCLFCSVFGLPAHTEVHFFFQTRSSWVLRRGSMQPEGQTLLNTPIPALCASKAVNDLSEVTPNPFLGHTATQWSFSGQTVFVCHMQLLQLGILGIPRCAQPRESELHIQVRRRGCAESSATGSV